MHRKLASNSISYAIFIIPLLICLGCSHGFDRNAMKEALNTPAVSPRQVITDAEIKQVLELKPQFHPPIKLGIYLTSYDGPNWRWSTETKEKLLAWFAAGPSKNIISKAFFVDDPNGQRADIKQIRLTAAQYGADAVLVINSVGATGHQVNPLFTLDVLTLTLTGLINPSVEARAIFMIRGALWDVRNGYLYAASEAEGHDEQITPIYWLNDNKSEAMASAQEQAITSFKADFDERLQTLR